MEFRSAETLLAVVTSSVRKGCVTWTRWPPQGCYTAIESRYWQVLRMSVVLLTRPRRVRRAGKSKAGSVA